MNIIAIVLWIVVGGVIGWFAGTIMKNSGGTRRNIIVGIVGSALGVWLASVLGIGGAGTFGFAGLLFAIGGAFLLLFLARLVFNKQLKMFGHPGCLFLPPRTQHKQGDTK